MQSEVGVIHHRTTYDDGLSSHSSGKMVAMHRIKKHGKQTPMLWIILSVVMTMGFATLFSSIQMQDSWLSISQAIAEQLESSPSANNNMVPVDTSPEALQRWRPERNRIWRHHPPEPRKTPIPSDVCGESPDFTKFFKEQQYNRRSLNDEDKTLHTLFSKEFVERGTSGTYVELGAYNGRAESNTRFFHECLGWQGILIEANPLIYNALVRNRPNDHRFSYSPTCTFLEELNNKTVAFHSIDATTAGIEGSALRHMGQAHVKVPCGTLTSLLTEVFPNGHVDFLSLDVENAEPEVVENLDFDQVFIELIIVENNSKICGPECSERDRVRKRLKGVGYKLYSNVVTESDLYIHPKSKYQLPKNYPKIPVEQYIAQGSLR
jgi:hypothetical protein